MPSSSETMGYRLHHDDHSATISSDVFFVWSDLKKTYRPSCHISLVAGSRHNAMSSPGRWRAWVIASMMTSTASSFDLRLGANPPSSPTPVLYPFLRSTLRSA